MYSIYISEVNRRKTIENRRMYHCPTEYTRFLQYCSSALANCCGNPRSFWPLKNNFSWQATVSAVSEITTKMGEKKWGNAGADHGLVRAARGACKAATTTANYLKRCDQGWGQGTWCTNQRAMVHWRSKLELPLGAEQAGRGRMEWKWSRAEDDDGDDDDYVTPKTAGKTKT